MIDVCLKHHPLDLTKFTNPKYDYKIIKKLGGGIEGQVFLASINQQQQEQQQHNDGSTDENNNINLAIKRITISNLSDLEQQIKLILQVCNVESTFNHQFNSSYASYASSSSSSYASSSSSSSNKQVVVRIVPHYDIFYKEYKNNLKGEIEYALSIVMACCDLGSLEDVILNFSNSYGNEFISGELKLNWMIDITRSLVFFHKRKLVHLDIKPDNILLQSKKTNDTNLSYKEIIENAQIYLSDFGLTREFKVGDSPLMSITGSKNYMAPEIFDGKYYNESVDMWALGIVALQLLVQKRRSRFDSLRDLLFNCSNNYETKLVIDNFISECIDKNQSFNLLTLLLDKGHSILLKLVYKCLRLDSSERLNATEYFSPRNIQMISSSPMSSNLSNILMNNQSSNLGNTNLGNSLSFIHKFTSTYYIIYRLARHFWDQMFGTQNYKEEDKSETFNENNMNVININNINNNNIHNNNTTTTTSITTTNISNINVSNIASSLPISISRNSSFNSSSGVANNNSPLFNSPFLNNTISTSINQSNINNTNMNQSNNINMNNQSNSIISSSSSSSTIGLSCYSNIASNRMSMNVFSMDINDGDNFKTRKRGAVIGVRNTNFDLLFQSSHLIDSNNSNSFDYRNSINNNNINNIGNNISNNNNNNNNNRFSTQSSNNRYNSINSVNSSSGYSSIGSNNSGNGNGGGGNDNFQYNKYSSLCICYVLNCRNCNFTDSDLSFFISSIHRYYMEHIYTLNTSNSSNMASNNNLLNQLLSNHSNSLFKIPIMVSLRNILNMPNINDFIDKIIQGCFEYYFGNVIKLANDILFNENSNSNFGSFTQSPRFNSRNNSSTANNLQKQHLQFNKEIQQYLKQLILNGKCILIFDHFQHFKGQEYFNIMSQLSNLTNNTIYIIENQNFTQQQQQHPLDPNFNQSQHYNYILKTIDIQSMGINNISSLLQNCAPPPPNLFISTNLSNILGNIVSGQSNSSSSTSSSSINANSNVKKNKDKKNYSGSLNLYNTLFNELNEYDFRYLEIARIPSFAHYFALKQQENIESTTNNTSNNTNTTNSNTNTSNSLIEMNEIPIRMMLEQFLNKFYISSDLNLLPSNLASNNYLFGNVNSNNSIGMNQSSHHHSQSFFRRGSEQQQQQQQSTHMDYDSSTDSLVVVVTPSLFANIEQQYSDVFNSASNTPSTLIPNSSDSNTAMAHSLSISPNNTNTNSGGAGTGVFTSNYVGGSGTPTSSGGVGAGGGRVRSRSLRFSMGKRDSKNLNLFNNQTNSSSGGVISNSSIYSNSGGGSATTNTTTTNNNNNSSGNRLSLKESDERKRISFNNIEQFTKKEKILTSNEFMEFMLDLAEYLSVSKIEKFRKLPDDFFSERPQLRKNELSSFRQISSSTTNYSNSVDNLSSTSNSFKNNSSRSNNNNNSNNSIMNIMNIRNKKEQQQQHSRQYNSMNNHTSSILNGLSSNKSNSGNLWNNSSPSSSSTTTNNTTNNNNNNNINGSNVLNNINGELKDIQEIETIYREYLKRAVTSKYTSIQQIALRILIKNETINSEDEDDISDDISDSSSSSCSSSHSDKNGNNNTEMEISHKNLLNQFEFLELNSNGKISHILKLCISYLLPNLLDNNEQKGIASIPTNIELYYFDQNFNLEQHLSFLSILPISSERVIKRFMDLIQNGNQPFIIRFYACFYLNEIFRKDQNLSNVNTLSLFSNTIIERQLIDGISSFILNSNTQKLLNHIFHFIKFGTNQQQKEEFEQTILKRLIATTSQSFNGGSSNNNNNINNTGNNNINTGNNNNIGNIGGGSNNNSSNNNIGGIGGSFGNVSSVGGMNNSGVNISEWTVQLSHLLYPPTSNTTSNSNNNSGTFMGGGVGGGMNSPTSAMFPNYSIYNNINSQDSQQQTNNSGNAGNYNTIGSSGQSNNRRKSTLTSLFGNISAASSLIVDSLNFGYSNVTTHISYFPNQVLKGLIQPCMEHQIVRLGLETITSRFNVLNDITALKNESINHSYNYETSLIQNSNNNSNGTISSLSLNSMKRWYENSNYIVQLNTFS
ncbi:predicted protein [Naegleria gruberi]|uniref:non-specific serine/threonine protein kinase n=1 Tax=Naegleria gruberi TaxID=5762 RepID=D2V1V3_NAEGR|nr:uncharacterized protein NAEGRDRAFT_62707 [Naegleria gruberi]EFC49374.1 predicted protein [Naegleria gruberi]|eukprot:XP_002682118.1 predicted protein [Naegleria gruberi strain NEG-M]